MSWKALGLLRRVVACATVTLAAAQAMPAAAQATAIPEGAALWFACTQPVFTGPLFEQCPLPYDPRYLQTFLAGFSRFTPENEFKMMYLEPEENHFDFTVADQIGRFALQYGKTVRGHTLIWNMQNPLWLSHPLIPWNATDLQSVMHTYISTVVGHFATVFPGVVTEWDVVNEPLNASGGLQPNPWEKVLGPGYIADALEYAHAADPAAKLVINDNGADTPGPKAEAMLTLATNLKRSGVPLNAVGFEAHVTPDSAPSLQDLVSLWRRYKAAGLNVEVTELDVADDNGIDDPAAKQNVIARYADACQVVGNCTGFTTWGVADSYSWLGASSGADSLLYGSDFQPSAAVSVVDKLLTGQHVSLSLTPSGPQALRAQPTTSATPSGAHRSGSGRSHQAHRPTAHRGG